VAQCARVLQPGGELRVATDVPGYFQVILKVLQAEPLLQPIAVLENAPLIPVAGAISNFERKAAEQGRMIGRATFVRARPPA
jgi:tRNA G46 methylase TrmB